ncbi:MAG: B12-binding domain-containing protein [Ilumatobacteraceae bacterium]
MSDTAGPSAVGDLTLQEAADQLGVHYLTAYRYVRLGLLPAVKAAGVWRVSPTDLAEFRAGGPMSPQVDGGSRRRAPWAERLEARLLAGDARGAWGVIEAALAAGSELDQIYLDVLAPAMTSIGDRWERGELDVSMEHRASGIAMRLVGRLGPRFVRRGRTRGAVVLGAPAGERHGLPIALLADLLRQHGWEVSDLGADVPHESLVHAVRSTPDVVAVGLSVTSDQCLASAAEALAALRAADVGVTLVVGGRAIGSQEAGRALGADLVALDARSFAEVLDRVRSEPDELPTEAAGN